MKSESIKWNCLDQLNKVANKVCKDCYKIISKTLEGDEDDIEITESLKNSNNDSEASIKLSDKNSEGFNYSKWLDDNHF